MFSYQIVNRFNFTSNQFILTNVKILAMFLILKQTQNNRILLVASEGVKC